MWGFFINKNGLQKLYKLKYSHPDASVLFGSGFLTVDDSRRCMFSIAVRRKLGLYLALAGAWHGVKLLSVTSDMDMANLALRKMSSGGGTGSTTGAELTESLLRSTTSIGPLMLFRWIWYFAGQFWTWQRCMNIVNHPLIKPKNKVNQVQVMQNLQL